MKQLDLIVFDLDDTLVLEQDFVLSGFRAVSSYIENTYQREGFYDHAEHQFRCGERGSIFNTVLGSLGIPFNPELIQELVSVYRKHSPQIKLIPEIEDLLSDIKGSGVSSGLITDGYSIAQNNKIKALDLHRYINKIVVTDDLGGAAYWKPNPTAYKLIADYYGIEHSTRCVYIGDNPTKDFHAPNELGWTSIRIIHEGGENSEKADSGFESCCVHSVRGLRDALRKIGGWQ